MNLSESLETKLQNQHQYKFFNLKIKNKWIEINLINGINNFITLEVLAEIDALINEISKDSNINCVVLKSGLNGIFSRGLDIKYFKSLEKSKKYELIAKAQNLLIKISKSNIPFISAIKGDCFGAGLELILACDIRIASLDSKFGASEVIFGLFPGAGAIQRLVKLIGKGHASRLLFTGANINAKEALRIGLVEEAIEENKLYIRTDQLAARIGRIPRSGILATKSAISYGMEHMLSKSILNDLKIFKMNF